MSSVTDQLGQAAGAERLMSALLGYGDVVPHGYPAMRAAQRPVEGAAKRSVAGIQQGLRSCNT